MRLPEPLSTVSWPAGWSDGGTRSGSPAGTLPKLTVITPSFRQAPFLEAAIRSVLQQGYPNLEYIVADGGSQDGSADIIRHYAPFLTTWWSERDEGQTHALEKALALATGDWITWINSDDLLAPGALWKVAEIAGDADVVAGTTQFFDAAGLRYRRPSRNISCENFVLEQLGSGLKWHQPSFWMRRPALQAIGFNRTLHYAFDYEMAIRYTRRHPKVRYVDDVLSWFRLHDESKTQSQGPKFRREQAQILRRLATEAEFAALAPSLDRAARAVDWLAQVDGFLDDRATPRLARLRAIFTGVRADPDARCSANTFRAARRILQYGGRRS